MTNGTKSMVNPLPFISISQVLNTPEPTSGGPKGMSTDKFFHKSYKGLSKCLENSCDTKEWVNPESTNTFIGHKKIEIILGTTMSADVVSLSQS